MRSMLDDSAAALLFAARAVVSDDDRDRGALAARLLQEAGFRVEATCPSHLLGEAVQVHAPDLLVMGGDDGADSLRQRLHSLREAEHRRGFAPTPVVLLGDMSGDAQTAGEVWVSPAHASLQLGEAALGLVSRTPHILIMEDDPLQQRILSRYLTMDGAATVYAVSNGVEALDYLTHHRVAMAILDMETPLLNGYATARALRSQSQTVRLPILALTGHTGESERQRCLDAGCSAHLAKPVTRQQLLSATQLLLAASNRPRPAAPVLPVDLQDLAERFLREVGAEAAERAVTPQTDMAELFRFVHSAKGTAAMFGFLDIADAAQSAVVAIRGGAHDAVPAHLAALARQFAATALPQSNAPASPAASPPA